MGLSRFRRDAVGEGRHRRTPRWMYVAGLSLAVYAGTSILFHGLSSEAGPSRRELRDNFAARVHSDRSAHPERYGLAAGGGLAKGAGFDVGVEKGSTALDEDGETLSQKVKFDAAKGAADIGKNGLGTGKLETQAQSKSAGMVGLGEGEAGRGVDGEGAARGTDKKGMEGDKGGGALSASGGVAAVGPKQEDELVGPKQKDKMVGPEESDKVESDEGEGSDEDEGNEKDEGNKKDEVVGPKDKDEVAGPKEKDEVKGSEGEGAEVGEVKQSKGTTKVQSTSKSKSKRKKDRANRSVRETLTYWKGSEDEDGFDIENSAFEASSPTKFLTFETDFGGFNNVRMALEVVCLTALLTGRTLVLPPPSAWYLLDWGKSTRIDIESADSVSEFADFFDLGDLGRAIGVISTVEFLEMGKTVTKDGGAEFPATFSGSKAGDKAFWREEARRTEWFAYLRKNWVKDNWNPFDVILMYPGVYNVFKAPKGVRPTEAILAERRYIDLPHRGEEHAVMHFPMDNDNGYRSLGQIATVAALGEARMHTEMHRFLRDAIHYRADIVEVAIKVVEVLGLYGYSSYHIRRNDLQYPSAFQEAAASLANTDALLTQGETLYISTDEADPAFFKAFTDAGYKVIKWADLVAQEGGLELDKVDAKAVGLVEQFICAGGRVFVGTKFSTYSSYIYRLRGYMHAPDLTQYAHNVKYSQPGQGFDPSPTRTTVHDLFNEHAELWEDI